MSLAVEEGKELHILFCRLLGLLKLNCTQIRCVPMVLSFLEPVFDYSNIEDILRDFIETVEVVLGHRKWRIPRESNSESEF